MARALPKIYRPFLCFFLSVCVGGCGRYAPPVPPELTSPKAVEFGAIVPSSKAIVISWSAPAEDARGEPLIDLNGYRVYRRAASSSLSLKGDPVVGGENNASLSLEGRRSINPDDLEFSLIEEIKDFSFTLLQKRKEEARNKGIPSRKIQLDSDEKTLTINDSKIEPGKVYLYKVAAFNERGVDGKVEKILRVRASDVSPPEVSFINSASFEDSSTSSAFDDQEGGVMGADPSSLF